MKTQPSFFLKTVTSIAVCAVAILFTGCGQPEDTTAPSTLPSLDTTNSTQGATNAATPAAPQ